MIRYKTVKKEGVAEQIIEKSRFIAYVKPVSSKEDADDFIAAIRLKHRDATHNVPAMVIGDKMQVQWASDDGEPQGTSGAPMVQMLTKEGITNVVVVVTRYFGGIKLGTGGLVRAYTGSAKLGLAAAGICAVKEMHVFNVKIAYSYLQKIQNLAQNGEFEINNIIYEDLVTVRIVTEPEFMIETKNMIVDMSSGAALIFDEGSELVQVDVTSG